MEIRVWGARGSIPSPGPATVRYGGNTSCVEVRLTDGTTIVLDAGSGIRPLGSALGPCQAVLLTGVALFATLAGYGVLRYAPIGPIANLTATSSQSATGTRVLLVRLQV